MTLVARCSATHDAFTPPIIMCRCVFRECRCVFSELLLSLLNPCSHICFRVGKRDALYRIGRLS